VGSPANLGSINDDEPDRSWQCKTFSLLVPQLSCIQTPKATVEPVSVATAFPVPAKITSTPNDQQTQYQTANNLAAEHKGTRNDQMEPGVAWQHRKTDHNSLNNTTLTQLWPANPR
jgi:hypothetical protein